MSHRKHAQMREAKQALRDPDDDDTARIEALFREAEKATFDAEFAAQESDDAE